MSPRLATLAAASVLALGACSSNVVVHEAGVVMTNYMDGEFEYAARSGEIRTEVVGNPFGVPQAQLEAAVTAAMYNANRGNAVVFAPRAARPTDDPYKVVLALDLPFGLVGDAVCAAEPVADYPARTGGTAWVTAAFCRGGSLMTHASGNLSVPVGFDSAAFRAMVREATYAMIPPYDKKAMGGGGSAGSP